MVSLLLKLYYTCPAPYHFGPTMTVINGVFGKNIVQCLSFHSQVWILYVSVSVNLIDECVPRRLIFSVIFWPLQYGLICVQYVYMHIYIYIYIYWGLQLMKLICSKICFVSQFFCDVEHSSVGRNTVQLLWKVLSQFSVNFICQKIFIYF